MPEKLSELIGVRFSEEAILEIEEWRRKQPTIPSRTDAIRWLVQKGLASAKSRGSKPRGG
jgi:hypothetical protein